MQHWTAGYRVQGASQAGGDPRRRRPYFLRRAASQLATLWRPCGRSGGGMCCYYFASGVEAPLLGDAMDDLDSDEKCVQNGTAICYGALAAVAGAGMFCYFGRGYLASCVKASLKERMISREMNLERRGPSRQEVRKLTALLRKVHRRLSKKEKNIKESEKDPMTWFNRIKDILSLPTTLRDLYATLVTVWFPLLKSSLDGTFYFMCPFSGLTCVVSVWTPEEENLPPQVVEAVETLTEVKDAKDKMVTLHRKKSLQHYVISAEGNCNFKKPFLYLARKHSRDMNLKFVEETPLQPADVTIDFVAQQRCAKSNHNFSNYNFEKPFLYLAWKPSGHMNIKLVE